MWGGNCLKSGMEPWLSQEGSLLGACVGGDRCLKLGTAGRWEVEGVPFCLSVVFSMKSEVGISARARPQLERGDMQIVP